MKAILFGPHRQLSSEVIDAVWWNDEFITKARLLNLSATPAIRFERLSYFHQNKITALGLALFCTSYFTAALLPANLDIFSCLLTIIAYSFFFVPLLLMLYGAASSWNRNKHSGPVALLLEEIDRRFGYAAAFLVEKISNPTAIIEAQIKVYRKLTTALTFVLVNVGLVLLGVVIGSGLSSAGYVVLSVWCLLLLGSTIFVFCPCFWFTRIKAQLEKRKSKRA